MSYFRPFLTRLTYAFLFLVTVITPVTIPAADRETPPLDVMIGSMIMCGFRGTELKPDDTLLHMIAAGHVGHVILFDRDVKTKGPRNITSPTQLGRLVTTLRETAKRPMFIAVDQEGGRVSRLKPSYGFSDLPSAMIMGKNKPSATRALARKTGEDMHAVGINVDFAPVADVAYGEHSVIGRYERSFGSDAKRAAAHVIAFGAGLADAGVIPTLKHFPGIGCASDDTHFLRADTSSCFDVQRDLLPFKKAIQSGWRGMVMVGHTHTTMDSVHPATLSAAVINGLLRQRLGWQGVVISDDMQMKAIADFYPLDQAILLAVEAGTDILLFGNNLNWQPDMPEKAYRTLLSLVLNGKISRERIALSFTRIQTLLSSFSE